ncbi:MAG: M23 family metallopeptidase, partial [Acidobacteriaceae bacterium]|nr:M23 family metallopeptidase [Acidobacteriaceae bacterium]
HSYPDYGADILAVRDGTVVETLDTLDNQVPGSLPDPKTVNVQNVDGNHIVLDLGNGFFAFYAHLQKHSILVKRGQHVKRGQILAKLGNTGNTSGPHLHFHIMDSPSVLGSNGLPYVIDSFAFDGQVSAAKFAAAPGVEGEWGEGRLRTSSPRERQFPLNLNIIDFPDRKAPAQ